MEEVSASARTPADFLKSIKGKPVVVKLNSGVDYRGKGCVLVCSLLGMRSMTELLSTCRHPGMPGWLHEHSHGANRGMNC